MIKWSYRSCLLLCLFRLVLRVLGCSNEKRKTKTFLRQLNGTDREYLIEAARRMPSNMYKTAYIGKFILSIHFWTELFDKLHNFWYWVAECETDGQPYPVLEMALVVVLLLLGTPLLSFAVSNEAVTLGCACLLIFQLPTTIFFESTYYEKFDSISVMGGLVLAMAYDWDSLERNRTRGTASDLEFVLLDSNLS
jgi:hypothetical protein